MNRVAIAVLALSLVINVFSQNEKTMSIKPTIILVHGLWADGSSWSKIIKPLQENGYDVISVQNPTTTLEEDVAAVNAAIDRVEGPVLLVGHSWGGFVITEAGVRPQVKGLVYVAAFAPDKGETVPTLSANAAATKLSAYLKDTNGVLTVSKKGVADAFAQDLPKDEQEMIYAVQQPASPKVFAGVGEHAAWKRKPSWFVVASKDKTINPELEEWMAKRAGAKITVVDSSHVAMVSKPDKVLKVIMDAADTIGK